MRKVIGLRRKDYNKSNQRNPCASSRLAQKGLQINQSKEISAQSNRLAQKILQINKTMEISAQSNRLARKVLQIQQNMKISAKTNKQPGREMKFVVK
jgi:hypothetical protein